VRGPSRTYPMSKGLGVFRRGESIRKQKGNRWGGGGAPLNTFLQKGKEKQGQLARVKEKKRHFFTFWVKLRLRPSHESGEQGKSSEGVYQK